jgi:tetratricopeptide (TPR) repeat protein
VPQQESPVKPAWQRWNDYGIGLLLEGGAGNKRGELRQAEDAFGRLLTLGEKDAVAHGHVNRARVFIELGRLGEAAKELEAAGKATPPAPWWTLAWFNAQVKLENATEPKHFEAAVSDLERILDPDTQPADRGFDFTKDYVVLDRLGQALFKRGQLAEDAAEQALWLRRSVAAYRKTLAIDPEDLDAHYGLSQCFGRLSADYDVPAGEAPEMEALQPLALVASNATLSPRDRIEAANRLVRGLEAMGKEAPQASRPKLPVVRTVWRPLLKAYRDEPDGPASVAVAAALAAAHREAHAVFKPDDIARAAATAEYRRHHPAANAAAEAVVIYPTGPKR